MSRRSIRAGFVTCCAIAATVGFVGADLAAQTPQYVFDTSDPACQAATLVSTGGQMPTNPRTLAIRWTGYANTYVNTLAADKAQEYVRTYKPGVYMPAHHDAPYNDLWRSTEPIFQGLKDENPSLITISKGYREPVCFSVTR